jgi:hypothetical protein
VDRPIFRYAKRLEISYLWDMSTLFRMPADTGFALSNSVLADRRTPVAKTCHGCETVTKLTEHASNRA